QEPGDAVDRADEQLRADEPAHVAEPGSVRELALGRDGMGERHPLRSGAGVNGIPCAAVLIQLGRSSSGTFAPVKISRKPKMTFESTAFSRIRRLAAAFTNPRPVQERAAIRTTSPSGASELVGRCTPRTSAPTSS